jgi:hypothetical protein
MTWNASQTFGSNGRFHPPDPLDQGISTPPHGAREGIVLVNLVLQFPNPHRRNGKTRIQTENHDGTSDSNVPVEKQVMIKGQAPCRVVFGSFPNPISDLQII